MVELKIKAIIIIDIKKLTEIIMSQMNRSIVMSKVKVIKSKRINQMLVCSL